MVVNDFHRVGVRSFPVEADAPLVIDPNAVLACAVTLQDFQSVAGWGTKVTQPAGLVLPQQFDRFRLCRSPGASANRSDNQTDGPMHSEPKGLSRQTRRSIVTEKQSIRAFLQ